MSEAWIISDTHFNHNKDFILQPRNFSTVEEMNEKIIERWNSVVQPNDTIYHLGDMTMGDIDTAVPLIARLNGKINLAIGNHDTNARLKTFG
jgi:calcineurin-like phosphoesterase family protein